MAAKPLTVLVTRPIEQAASLLQKLQQQGWNATHIPSISIDPLPVDARMRQIAQDLDQYDSVIFISANAAQFGMALFDEYWPQWPIRVQWIAVGKATQAALATHQIEAITPTQADSEGVLALPQLNLVEGQKILIVRGEGGRETLAETLRLRGAKVIYLELYRRNEVANAEHWRQQLHNSQFDLITSTSGDALKGLMQLWGTKTPPLTEKVLFVVSQRLANYAATLGFTHIIQTDGASDEAILSALKHWNQP